MISKNDIRHIVIDEPVDMDSLISRHKDCLQRITDYMWCNQPDVLITGLHHIQSNKYSLTYTEPGTGIVTHRTRINILGNHSHAGEKWTGWIDMCNGYDMRVPCIEYINQDNQMFTFMGGIPYKMYVESEASRWWCADIGQTNMAFGGEVKKHDELDQEPWITLVYGASAMGSPGT